MQFSKIFAIVALAATSARALPAADANSNLAVGSISAYCSFD
jgi:hypothetical protein